MKRRAGIICAALFGMLAITGPAVAATNDTLTTVVSALKASPVYVAPGTETTDSNTAPTLKGELTTNDDVVLVMLPQSAAGDVGDPMSFAVSLSQQIGPQHIIGLTVGSHEVAYSTSPALPASQATDLMGRAHSVSMSTVETLQSFVHYVHAWQQSNPEPPRPSPTTAKAKSSSGNSGIDITVPVLVGVIAACIALGFWRISSGGRRTSSRPTPKATVVPEGIESLLTRCRQLTSQIAPSSELYRILSEAWSDVESYFIRSKDAAANASIMQDHLDRVRRVLERYIDLQQNPRYYRDPDSAKARAARSLTQFAEWVLEAVRDGSDVDLASFEVDTAMLTDEL